MAKDYYAPLGVSRTASEKEIKAAYRKLARKFHPDVNPNDKSAEAKFKEIQEAFDVVGDPDRRKLYDQYGSNWEAAEKMGGVPGPGGEGMPPDYDFTGGSGDFESIFQNLFGGGFGSTKSRRVRINFDDSGFAEAHGEEMRMAQPRDVEKSIDVPLEEIDKGAKRRLTYQTLDAVQSLDGRITTVPRNKEVTVNIPTGIADGKKLRLSGMGAAGIKGRAGDLYVTVKWVKHPLFKPSGKDLEVEVEVPFTTAALGGEITVPTLRGKLKMRIPSGSQSGQRFRLAGQGISRLEGGRSDLFARVKITVPKNLSDEQKALLRKLAELEAKA